MSASWVVVVATAVVLPASVRAAGPPADAVARVDKVFEKYETTESPGCAIAVAEGGKTVLARAYGMSDLERETPNTVDTVFEAGSVSKQFTAAAVMLLARDGKLSLDDPVRKHIPELPDYGAPLTVRHMLTHTSGLRDWGAVVAAAGWPRGSRVHTHGHVLEVLSRQKALNFPSGTEFSYSNSGYNLAAILVSRVAGKPFAEFTRERMFLPLGMTRTEWRDDYARIVKGRATAYSKGDTGWRQAMPFENVHGNGGLLTTVSDLLRWNAALDAGTLAGPEFTAEQQKTGTLADGRPIRYAMGLYAENWKGAREGSHGGATGGYRAVLARYPDHGLSVAVLCNADNANAGALGHQVADVFLEGKLAASPAPAPATATIAADVLGRRAGLYRHPRTMDVVKIDVVDGVLKVNGRNALLPVDDRRFLFEPFPATRVEFEVDAAGSATALAWIDADGPERHQRVQPAALTAERRGGYAGRYVAPEADAIVTIAVDGEDLVARQGPDWTGKMAPADADIFTIPGTGTFAFDRGRDGNVTGFRFFSGRLRGLRFDREARR
jgi:CubicO group peptidase (beta-lactamase class C family)